MDYSTRRIIVVKNHLLSSFPSSHPDRSLDEYRKLGTVINQKIVAEVYQGKYFEVYQKLRNAFKDSSLFDHFELLFLTKQEAYVKVLEQAVVFQSKALASYATDKADPIYKISTTEILSEFDLVSATRYGVHFGLYIDTIQSLGTLKHDHLINLGYSLKHYGCFALTELGHGSNVAKLETIASYNHKTREFIFNSPTKTSAK